jgi:hypothetical protein
MKHKKQSQRKPGQENARKLTRGSLTPCFIPPSAILDVAVLEETQTASRRSSSTSSRRVVSRVSSVVCYPGHDKGVHGYVCAAAAETDPAALLAVRDGEDHEVNCQRMSTTFWVRG